MIIEEGIKKLKHRVILRYIFKASFILLPLCVFITLYLKSIVAGIFALLIPLMVYILYLSRKYSDIHRLDKFLHLNNVISTYYDYKGSANPFYEILQAQIEKKLGNWRFDIYPEFETISFAIALSILIFVIFNAKHIEKYVKPTNSNITKYIVKNMDESKHKNTNIPKNESLIGINAYNTSLPKIVNTPDTYDRDINVDIKNKISKEEKKIIKSIMNNVK